MNNNNSEKEEKKENSTSLDLLYLYLLSLNILKSKINLLKLYIGENEYDTESIKMDLNNEENDDSYDNKELNFLNHFNNEKFINFYDICFVFIFFVHNK